MDPQTKGLLLGSLSSAAVLTLGYLASRGLGGSSQSESKPVERTNTQSKEEIKEETKRQNQDGSHKIILLGDVGGTNVRLILKKVSLQD